MNITIPKKLESLNVTLRWHWARRSKEKQAWMKELMIYKSKVRKPFTKLEIISSRKRLLDKDNLYGGAKHLIDAIKEMGWIINDDPKSCEVIVLQTIGDEKTIVKGEI